MSLFFSKPEPYYTQKVEIQLKSECANLSSTDENLQILTQRLKYYAERRSQIILRDTYSAKAYSMESLKALFEKDSERVTRVIISTAIFVVLFSVIIIAIALVLFFGTESHAESKWAAKVKKNSSAVLSLTVLSLIANLYIICLTISALDHWWKYNDDALGKLFHGFDEKRNLGPMFIALIVDIACVLLWGIFVWFGAKKQLSKHGKNCESIHDCGHSKCHCDDCISSWCVSNNCVKRTASPSCKECRYTGILTLSLTILCPLFCVIAHSPYIAIAYLNDGSHASSIFIYYAFIGYTLFGLLYVFLRWLENKNNIIQIMCKCECNPLCTCTIFFLFIVIVIFLGLVVVISCYFVLIPINKAISDAPNRILSIYQSGGFVIGSIFVYELLSHFHKKKKESATEDIRNDVKKIHNDVKKILQQCHVKKEGESTNVSPNSQELGQRP